VSATQAEAKKRAEEADRQAKVRKALADGKAALGAKNLQAAADAFASAARLAPQDPDVIQAQQDLTRARQAADAQLAAQKQRQQQFDNLMKAGDVALKAQKYADAVKAFHQAHDLMPADKLGVQKLAQAQTALAGQQKADDQKQAAARKLATFNALVTQGQTDLKQGKYADALKLFNDAKLLIPDNATVAPLIAQAQKGLDSEAGKTGEFNTLVKQGQAALKAGKYADAVKAFTAAQKLMPGNMTVPPLLQQAQNALDAERIAQAKQKAAEAKKLDDFNTHMQQGQAALKAGKYADAVKAFTAARQLFPNNMTVPPLLQQAQNALDAERSALEKQKAAEVKKLTDFNMFMKRGQEMMAATKYQEAVVAYSAALKLYPNSVPAQQGLQQARQALNPPPQVVAAFNKKMQDALVLEKQERWNDVLKLYQEAVNLIPTDGKAKDKLKFTTHLTEGQKHLAARRFVEAQREFEAAVALFPNVAAAQTGLKKAKNKMQ
jgi:tetratricopeptide (TPR) repeat protein